MVPARTVLHVIDTTGPGGAETVFIQLAAGLQERGWDARMVVVGQGWVLDEVHKQGLPVDVVRTSGRFDARYAIQLAQIVRRHRVCLIHAHLFSPAVYASLVGMLTRIPVVTTFHGASDIVADSAGGRLRYRLIKHAARVVCVSRSLKRQLQSVPALGRQEADVVYNGVDPDTFAMARSTGLRDELGWDKDTFVVGAVGNMRPAKDYPTLLRAAARLADRNINVAIAGEMTEPLYGELCRARTNLGLEGRVAFLGFRHDVPALMNAFDVLVISSTSEGFSLAAIQAMAAGTPVVATRSGGPEEIITHGSDGLLVQPGDDEAIMESVVRLRDDRTLRAALTVRAQHKVRERFSLEAMLDGYERIYQELAFRRSTRFGATRLYTASTSEA